MKCKKCDLESVDKKLFVKRSDRKSGYRNICKNCSNKTHVKYSATIRDKKRNIIHQFKDKPCSDCGIKYPHYVMDLDHKNPKDKVRNISDFLRDGTLQELSKELLKCELVCSNCHRERTHSQNHYMYRK